MHDIEYYSVTTLLGFSIANTGTQTTVYEPCDYLYLDTVTTTAWSEGRIPISEIKYLFNINRFTVYIHVKQGLYSIEPTNFWSKTINTYLSQYLTNLMHNILFHNKFYFMPLHVSSTWYHHTYRCDDTRGCVMPFWPPDDENMCSKHVEAWNKTYCETKFGASSWLNTEINLPRCTVSKTSKSSILSLV